MNGAVKLTTNFFKTISKYDFKMQTGNVQSYNAYALIIFTVIIGLVLFIYTILYSQYN